MSHIDIVVDTAPQGKYGTFVPGQDIAGKAIYSPPNQVDVDNVDIIFKGTCYTDIKERHGNGNNGGRSTRHYRETIVLFRFLSCLFRGPNTLQAGRYEWPFSFTLPDGATYERKSQSLDRQFQVGAQSLPPSFNLNSEIHAHPPDATISYRLKVKVNPGRMLHSAERVYEIPVWPVSPTPLSLPQPTDTPCQGDGRFKSKDLRPVQHTFKEKLNHVFTSDPSLKTPEINISAVVKAPRSAGISQPLPIEIACTYRRTGETDPEKPNLNLRDCQVVLKAYVFARSMGNFSDHSNDGKQTVISRTIASGHRQMPIDGSFIPMCEPICLADMSKTGHGLVPSFKTWTISMTYKLTIRVSISHAESGHVLEFESKVPFEILPEPSSTPAYAAIQPTQMYNEGDPSALYPPQLPPDAQPSGSNNTPPFYDASAPPSYDSRDVWHTNQEAKKIY